MHGRVTAGPTCPVERPGQPCPPSPVAGRVEAIDAAGHAAGNAPTDADGRYAIALPPGAYTLRVATEAMFPMCPDTAVMVPSGPPVAADVDCDTGIRYAALGRCAQPSLCRLFDPCRVPVMSTHAPLGRAY